MTEFDHPPADPMELFAAWFAAAKEAVREPGVVALATANADGVVSNRIVQTIKLTDTGWVFTSHAGSQKGQDIAATGWASGVFYWRETSQQLIIAGQVARLSDEDCDELWFARDPSTHPMSVAASQSALLEDEEALRARAQQLADSAQTLARPVEWLGYELVPSIVEFWKGSKDRLHRRLRYDRNGHGWTSRRLQP
ncbi:phenazine biosynthesis FMN-dependent oxidase PhzG [Kibdelosporangium philippinense]|uniref:Phenazine biosynthesis FMN-dependent oxidase PhzG n=1 Tax=Kibdelosporangium philippinense TaxID=211113 RepID=A0ABS8Z4B1_9PSEU|nr:phenazine biosynthesis FMN-dependent oxidase PhzG [Kibdelosporangium philippinense]MCE7001511.1 phenazine biosynthesis FMN-dependent oxidase PhzG [Kibdelosporangium philippinense]